MPADLKRQKLTELMKILDDQMDYAQRYLDDIAKAPRLPARAACPSILASV